MARPRSTEETTKTLEIFGLRLRNWRQKKKLSLDGLSEKSGMDKSHLSELERGKTNPSLTTILRLAEALEVNPSVFFLTLPEARQVQKTLGVSPGDIPDDPGDLPDQRSMG